MTTTRSTQLRPNPCLRLLALILAWVAPLVSLELAHGQTASLSLAGLRTAGGLGQFNGIQTDSAGNLYLLLDQHDGVRLLKTDATATTVLAQAHVGAKGDTGVALAVDPSGNLYVTGPTSSGSLTATAGSAFPTATGTSTSFVAKFDAALNPLWITFTGCDKMAATALAATASGVFVTGSIFSANLPVTPSAILQAPSYGSLQNGFAEKFDPSGATLLYATYLTGAGGETSPAGIAADTAGNAYIVGYTTAPGYPTLNALVPNIIPNAAGATSGLLTQLTPAADGLGFSTFIPGAGLASIALDSANHNLLITGDVAIGRFPVATVQTPILPIPYQTLLRVPLDGSTVISSTLLAPGTESIVHAGSSGAAWVAGDLTLPVLPAQPFSTLGDTYAAHVTAQSTIDQVARFGGLPTVEPTFASVPVAFTSLATDALGQPTFAGSVTPQASVSLIPTESYDFPLFGSLSAALPSTLRDAIPTPASCVLSLCPGSAAYLARLTDGASPSLALSYDAAPNLTLRNLGATTAHALSISATGFTLTTNCPSDLASGSECSIALAGAGAGSVTLQSADAPSQTIVIPAFSASPASVVVSPKELDFGVQTSTSAAAKRAVTITNLTAQAQTFTSKLDTTSRSLPYAVTEDSSDCTLTGLNTKLLAAGASCHITLALAAASTPANDTLVSAHWLIGPQDILLTGYTQAAALTVSATEIDFGTQYTGGLRLPRFLYLSNSSDTPITHAAVNSIVPFTIQDLCPSQLQPHTVCQIQIDYVPTRTPGNDSITLTLDQGLTALLTGQSLPQTGSTGATVNPNLTVSPTTISFPNSVVVTTASSSAQTVTIGNTGSTSFRLTLGLTGDFTDTTNCPTLLPANTTCTAFITFTPSQPGGRQGLLSVTAGANSSPVYVNLSGTGTAILPANNGTLDFGSVTVGQPTVQWFKVSQTFRTLTGAASGDFTAVLVEDTGYGHGKQPTSAFASTASGTCFNCWLGLQFRPSETGPRSTTLSLTSSSSGAPYTVTLTGTGLPLLGLVLTPGTQDFGSVPINSTSGAEVFTLTNLTSNSVPITLTAPAVSGDFAVSAATTGTACTDTLSAFASCFVEVAFSPTAAGQRSGTLTLATSGGTVTSTLTGYGLPSAALSLSPTALIFRNVPGAAATTQTITLTNAGTSTLQIAAPTVATASFVPSTTCSSLAPGASCAISVNFVPGNAAVTDTLEISTSADVSGSTVVATYAVPLSGAYTTQTAGLQITPAQADFGPNPTGSVGLSRQFTIKNLTAKSMTVSISIPRQFALSGPPCAGLAPNASCSFSLTFVPLTNGDITGSLFAQAVPADGSATLNAIGYVEGYGTGAGALSFTGPLSPGKLLNFGQVSSGQALAKTLTLTNKGGGSNSSTLTVRRVTSQWPFLSTSTCGQALALNQSCTVTVTYTPLNQQSTGTNSPLPTAEAGTLTVESDAGTSPDLLDLGGTAAPVLVTAPSGIAPLFSYTASQNSLSFPATAVGNISVPQTVTLANTGTSTLHLLSAGTTADFSVTNPCSTIVPGASCDLEVSFAPTSSGTRISAIEILTDSSSSLNFISLVGAADPSLLTLTPAALDFGTVNLGASTALSLQITNTASAPAVFQSFAATGDYTVANASCPTSGGSLAPGASCTLQISFAPNQIGTRAGVLSLATSISTLPITANLSGVGAQARLQISLATTDFGSVAVGASASRTLALTNTGNASITGISAAVSSGDFAVATPCSSAAMNPGDTCSVTVTFTPTGVGTRTGALTVTSSAPSSPSLVSLTGTGLAGGSFTLSTDQGSTSSSTVRSGEPATYNLTLTPSGNYSGTVVLNCTPISPADYATCSLAPSSITLSGTSKSAQAVLQTITSVRQSWSGPGVHPFGRPGSRNGAVLALLTPAFLLILRRPHSMQRRSNVLWTALLAEATFATLLAASGCGGGGDPNLRYSTPGTYQYRVTASSTSGVATNQSVTLNLTIQPR